MDQYSEFASDSPIGSLRQKEKTYPNLIFKNTLIYSLAFAAGMALWYIADFSVGRSVKEAIASRFSGVFSECSSIKDFFEILLRCCSSDVRHITLAFMAGFTMLAGMALACLLIFRGAALGFSTAYLLCAIREGSAPLSELRLCIYLALSALVAAAVICFCSHCAIFSDEFRALGGRRSLILHSPVLWRQIFAFLLTLGFAVFLGLLNCIG